MIALIKYMFQFLFLVALQVLVLNNIELIGYMNPYLYVIFIIMLPTDINRNLLLILSFALGFCVDVFENSGAIHASAALVFAFIRPFVFRLMTGRNNSEIERMNIQTLGQGRFMIMAAILVFAHHFWLFSLEAFAWREFWQVLQRTILSSIFTLVLIYITQILVYRKEK